MNSSAIKSIQCFPLPLQSIKNIPGRNRLSTGIFCVYAGILNYILKKNLEDAADFFVNETGDTLDATMTCKATDGGFGYAVDVIF